MLERENELFKKRKDYSANYNYKTKVRIDFCIIYFEIFFGKNESARINERIFSLSTLFLNEMNYSNMPIQSYDDWYAVFIN